MPVSAFVCGCAGLSLDAWERRFFREAQPWGLILFKRNVENPAQVADLTASFRETVGRADAPVLIDQEGGRVQRLGPPHWPAYPPAASYLATAGDVEGAAKLVRLTAQLHHEVEGRAGLCQMARQISVQEIRHICRDRG